MTVYNNANTIKEIMSVIGYKEDHCGNAVEYLWTPDLVKAIYVHVEKTFDLSELENNIEFLKIVADDANDEKITKFDYLFEKSESVIKEEIVAKWDEEYCELFGFDNDNNSALLYSFLNFLNTNCRPILPGSINPEKLIRHVRKKMTKFFEMYNGGDCDEDWECSTEVVSSSPPASIITFPNANFLLYRSPDFDKLEAKIKRGISGTTSPFLNIPKYAGKVPFFDFFIKSSEHNLNIISYDANEKKWFYFNDILLAMFVKIRRDMIVYFNENPPSGWKILSEDFSDVYKSIVKSKGEFMLPSGRIGKLLGNDPGNEEISFKRYTKSDIEPLVSDMNSIFDAGKNQNIIKMIVKDILLKNKIVSSAILNTIATGLLKEDIGGNDSSPEYSEKESTCPDPDAITPEGTQLKENTYDLHSDSKTLSEMLNMMILDIENKLNEDKSLRGAKAPAGRGGGLPGGGGGGADAGVASVNPNVPEFCKIDWPNSKRTSGGIPSSITSNPQIENTWGWIFPFLPASAKINSGSRTEKRQLKIILDYSKSKSINIPADVSSYYSSMSDTSKFNPSDTVRKSVKKLVSELRGMKVKIAMPGKSNHNDGKALDIATTEVERVTHIIKTVKKEINKGLSSGSLNIGIVPEPNNGSGAVHIDIKSVIRPRAGKINKIWKKIENCKSKDKKKK